MIRRVVMIHHPPLPGQAKPIARSTAMLSASPKFLETMAPSSWSTVTTIETC